MSFKDEKIKKVAIQFLEEIGGIAPAFNNYLNKWANPASIERNPSEFINETNELFNALKNRIERENNILYPLIDQSCY
ncbi:MAG TPA: hypothetical protein ENI58_07480 [Nitrospirae bacterium]|nr:hypothetical protein [Nitrospirota bacterium]